MSLIKLQKLIDSGKQLVYRDQIAVFKSFENKRGVYEIIVELDHVPTIFNKQNEEKIEIWLSNFTPAVIEDDKNSEMEVSTQVYTAKLPVNNYQPAEATIYAENKEALLNLSKILFADIEKVRAEPGYVPQAKQICNSVNAIVNITRLQLQLVKLNP